MGVMQFRVRLGQPGEWGAWSADQFALRPPGGAGFTLRPVTLGLGDLPEGAAVGITSQPEHGHVSVNPDNTLAVVLSGTAGTITFGIAVSAPDAASRAYTVQVEASEGPIEGGWGTGSTHYMLPVDADDRVTVEHGDVHRKVYIAPDGLTAAQIAATESVSEGTVTATWLRDSHPEYGATENAALHPDIGFPLWRAITREAGAVNSHWLLLRRGGSYTAGTDLFAWRPAGESPLHPRYHGAWGEGADPMLTLTADDYFWGTASGNVVVQGIRFTQGVGVIGVFGNVLYDGVVTEGSMLQLAGVGGRLSGITVRNSLLYDVYRPEPVGENSDTTWSSFDNGISGILVGDVDGLLIEGTIVDRCGWAPGYAADASVASPQPPSTFSHNIYIQYTNTDVTYRQSVTMRAATNGAQIRCGGYVEDNLYLDNNVAGTVNGGSYEGGAFIGNYSLFNGNVLTAASIKGEGESLPNPPAPGWGMSNQAPLTALTRNIVVHANDPDNAGETWAGSNALNNSHSAPAFDDTIIYRWGSTDANIDGLDTGTLNTTTIQRYTAALLSQPTATIDDLGTYLRGLEPTEYKAAGADILAYFRAGFGLSETPRAVAATLRFVPDDRGDGVRWDNRLNWSTGDLPGTVSGDSVNLGGNRVVFGGTVSLVGLALGTGGGITVNHGKLTAPLTGATGATLDIGNAGQVWASGATGTLDVTVAGGRLANTGLWQASGDITASGGQVILATGAAEFRLFGRLDISAGAKVGFDGASGAAALVMQSGATLGFVSSTSALPMLGEFRSGAFGAAPAVTSAVTLAGALEVTVTDLVGTGAFTLIDVDTLTGALATATVTGLGSRDAAVAVDRAAGTVTLTLTAGTGQTTLTQTGV